MRERKWEVIFLTSRPETSGDTAQLQSQRWLVERGFPLPSVFVVHGSRGKIAASLQLDVLVDDRPENCLDVAIDSTARAILVWRGGEDKVPGSARQLGIGAVTSIAECLDILEALDRAEDEMGLVDRFKRLLGLKPSRRSPAKPAGSPSSRAADGTDKDCQPSADRGRHQAPCLMTNLKTAPQPCKFPQRNIAEIPVKPRIFRPGPGAPRVH